MVRGFIALIFAFAAYAALAEDTPYNGYQSEFSQLAFDKTPVARQKQLTPPAGFSQQRNAYSRQAWRFLRGDEGAAQ